MPPDKKNTLKNRPKIKPLYRPVDIPGINASVETGSDESPRAGYIFYVLDPVCMSTQDADVARQITDVPQTDGSVVGARGQYTTVEEPEISFYSDSVKIIYYSGKI